MKIVGWSIAEAFAKTYPQARSRLENWRKHVQNAIWKKPVDIVKTFNSASNIPIKQAWVFNIGSDRLVAVVDFTLEVVLVKQVMAHDEYMKWSNRK